MTGESTTAESTTDGREAPDDIGVERFQDTASSAAVMNGCGDGLRRHHYARRAARHLGLGRGRDLHWISAPESGPDISGRLLGPFFQAQDFAENIHTLVREASAAQLGGRNDDVVVVSATRSSPRRMMPCP